MVLKELQQLKDDFYFHPTPQHSDSHSCISLPLINDSSIPRAGRLARSSWKRIPNSWRLRPAPAAPAKCKLHHISPIVVPPTGTSRSNSVYYFCRLNNLFLCPILMFPRSHFLGLFRLIRWTYGNFRSPYLAADTTEIQKCIIIHGVQFRRQGRFALSQTAFQRQQTKTTTTPGSMFDPTPSSPHAKVQSNRTSCCVMLNLGKQLPRNGHQIGKFGKDARREMVDIQLATFPISLL